MWDWGAELVAAAVATMLVVAGIAARIADDLTAYAEAAARDV